MSFGEASPNLKHVSARLLDLNRIPGQRCGSLHDSHHPSSSVDEEDIEGEKRVLHPELAPSLAVEHEQHRPTWREVPSKHEASLAVARGDRKLRSDLHRTMGGVEEYRDEPHLGRTCGRSRGQLRQHRRRLYVATPDRKTAHQADPRGDGLERVHGGKRLVFSTCGRQVFSVVSQSTLAERGMVRLVGAGPGDPGLITLRAVRALESADLVLYDALVHPELLEHASSAERVFVGKRGGKPSVRQTSINEQMAQAARSGRTVVRLKGGDPYLFGRGSEEAEFLHAQGIPFEVIPGIPSTLAVSAYAGFSLTHRHLASSVAYVTATESPDKDRTSHDWAKLATGPETLVIFMGLRRIASLMNLLIEHGRNPDTPAAAVMNASLPSQKTVVGTVRTLPELVRAADLHLPTLLLVGEVVGLRPHLSWFEQKPLFGKRVLVTRPRGQARELSDRLREQGAEPIELPTIRIEEPEDIGPLREAVKNASRYRWVVFTSRNGVDRFFGELHRQSGDARRLRSARIAAIGPGTAAALRRYGIVADLVPTEHKGEALAEALLRAADPITQATPILLPRAQVARDVVPNALREAGAQVDVVAAYRSVSPTEEDAERLRQLVLGRELDIATFTASSTVSQLVDLLGEGGAEALSRLTVASIGPITTETANRLGVRVAVSANRYTIEGLVSALANHFESVNG